MSLCFSSLRPSLDGVFSARNLLISAVMLLIGMSGACSADAPSHQAPSHPTLIITAEDAELLRAEQKDYPVFSEALADLKADVDARMLLEIDVPVPADAGGGYTHEQHKANYKTIYEAGLLYQITLDTAYSEHAKKLLLEYAALYPSLGEHPQKKEQTPGRLFWQSLNESVWLVYSIQGYDAIYDALSETERDLIETQLFRPMARFLSEESPRTFNKIHNHGTWAVAAVGMTGYVLGEQEYVEKALYGLDKSGEGGFVKQLDQLFSPDGYYNEGPYYHRYALMPFVYFAKAVDNNEPEREIFSHRDGILLKAIYSAVQLSYNGLFFPINDALKDKGIDTTELIQAVAIAYGLTKDPTLLSIAREQGSMVFSADGLSIAKALGEGQAQPFQYRSMTFRDGPNGDQGALVVMRSGSEDGHQAIVAKNTSQGLGHGHFDKLHWLFYDNGNEIVTDYGASRFLNIEAKYGGHYLPENKTWAKQTVAHNTLVVDQQSHFGGKLSEAQKVTPVSRFDSNEAAQNGTQEGVQPEGMQIASAIVSDTYPGVDLIRTIAMLKDPAFEHPLVLDVMRVISDSKHQYDLPLHYQGQIIETSFPLTTNTESLKPLGENNGYQHLWHRATGAAGDKLPQVTWLTGNRFYTYSMAAAENQEFIFTQLGATDPNFNLRSESAVIQRLNGARNHSFVSILEPHGEYNGVLEYTRSARSQISDVRVVSDDEADFVTFESVDGSRWGLAVAYTGDEQRKHQIQVDGVSFNWQGHYRLFSGLGK